jgi:chromosome segregation ATPase
MSDLADDVVLLKQRMAELEEWAASLAEVHRRTTEELREAAGRLDSSERRYSQLLERHERLEQYAAEQLGQDVAELRRTVRGIGIVASSAFPLTAVEQN